jgi:hypothetical protein
VKGEAVSAEDIAGWSAGQIVVFLDELVLGEQTLSEETLQKMDKLYNVLIINITCLTNLVFCF